MPDPNDGLFVHGKEDRRRKSRSGFDDPFKDIRSTREKNDSGSHIERYSLLPGKKTHAVTEQLER
jgi:hypothetical protein